MKKECYEKAVIEIELIEMTDIICESDPVADSSKQELDILI